MLAPTVFTSTAVLQWPWSQKSEVDGLAKRVSALQDCQKVQGVFGAQHWARAAEVERVAG